MRKTLHFPERLSRAFCNVGAAGLLILAALVSVDVAVRAITGKPIMGVFEVSGVILVATVFLPLSFVFFLDRQMKIDILYGFVPVPVQHALTVLDRLIGIVIFGLILMVSAEETMKAYTGRYLLRGLVEIPTWIPYLTISVGMTLSILVLVVQVVGRGMQLWRDPGSIGTHSGPSSGTTI